MRSCHRLKRPCQKRRSSNESPWSRCKKHRRGKRRKTARRRPATRFSLRTPVGELKLRIALRQIPPAVQRAWIARRKAGACTPDERAIVLQ